MTTPEQRAREMLVTALDGLQMDDRQRHSAVTSMLAFANAELERAGAIVEVEQSLAHDGSDLTGSERKNHLVRCLAREIRNLKHSGE